MFIVFLLQTAVFETQCSGSGCTFNGCESSGSDTCDGQMFQKLNKIQSSISKMWGKKPVSVGKYIIFLQWYLSYKNLKRLFMFWYNDICLQQTYMCMLISKTTKNIVSSIEKRFFLISKQYANMVRNVTTGIVTIFSRQN